MLNNNKQNFDFKLNSNNVTSLDNISLEQFHNEPSVRSNGSLSKPSYGAVTNTIVPDLKSKSNKFIPIINNYEFNSHSLKPKKIAGESALNGAEKKTNIIKADHSNNLLMKAVSQVVVANTPAQVNPATFKNAIYTDNVSRQSSIRSLLSSSNNSNNNNNNKAATPLNSQQQTANMSNFAKIKQTKTRLSIESENGTFANEIDLLNDWDAKHNGVNVDQLCVDLVSSNSSGASNGPRSKTRMGFQPSEQAVNTTQKTLNDLYSNKFSKSYSNISNGAVPNGQIKSESVKIIKPQPVYSSNDNGESEARHYNSFAKLSAHKSERTNLLNSFGKSSKLEIGGGSYSAGAANETESIVSDNFMNNLRFDDGMMRSDSSGRQQNGYNDKKTNGKSPL